MFRPSRRNQVAAATASRPVACGAPPSTSLRTSLGRALATRVIRVIRGALLLRREGGDDFFEARIAAQRVPERHPVSIRHS